jgi:hypothetical protein
MRVRLARIWQCVAMTSADDRLQAAIGRWLPKLKTVHGWDEWKRQMLSHALWFDDEFPGREQSSSEFELPEGLDCEHAVVMSYYALHSTITSLRDCEYYFRRYPFGGLPISKHEHLRYICEMYFGRFYEFRSRTKECFKAVNALAGPVTRLELGQFIKAFDKEFDAEIRERNKVHHHNRFEDIAIDNLMMTALAAVDAPTGSAWKRRNDAFYRRASREWAERVVKRSSKLEEYLNAIAEAILASCPFLGELAGSKGADRP